MSEADTIQPCHEAETAIPDFLMAPSLGAQESTLAIIKSHICNQGPVVVGQILNCIWSKPQIGIAAIVATNLSHAKICQLYQDHVRSPYWPELEQSVNNGVLVMALRGPNVIQRWRDMLGNTNSMLAKAGTLRERYGSRSIVADNVAHGSDSIPSARRELALFFPQHIQLWASA